MNILLADDHGLFRDSMAVWLRQLDDNVHIEFASDWTSLTKQWHGKFDLLMLDLGMPGMFGATSICELLKQFPNIPILVVSAVDDQNTIDACLTCGASGYITKASNGQDILKAVSIVLNGGIYQPPITAQNESTLTTTFTKKQFELLSYLAKGDSNKSIAKKMELSEGTIKQYVSQLLTILNVDNRTQAGNKAKKILGF